MYVIAVLHWVFCYYCLCPALSLAPLSLGLHASYSNPRIVALVRVWNGRLLSGFTFLGVKDLLHMRFDRCKRVVTLSSTSQHKDGTKPAARGREAEALPQAASSDEPFGLHAAHGGTSLLPRGVDMGMQM